jgi:hypothetical protein
MQSTASSSRAASIHSLRGVPSHSSSSAARPRTYFSHTGQVTVETRHTTSGGMKAPVPKVAELSQTANDAASGKNADKKKRRFSFSIGKKGSAAAAR